MTMPTHRGFLAESEHPRDCRGTILAQQRMPRSLSRAKRRSTRPLLKGKRRWGATISPPPDHCKSLGMESVSRGINRWHREESTGGSANSPHAHIWGAFWQCKVSPCPYMEFKHAFIIHTLLSRIEVPSLLLIFGVFSLPWSLIGNLVANPRTGRFDSRWPQTY